MTIVCATHFTESSGDALAVASQLARRTAQPLWLVSVVNGLSLGPAKTASRELQAAQTTLHAQAAALRKEGLTIEVAVLQGRFEKAVGRLCNDVGAGLLVLGDTRHMTPSFMATPADRLASSVSAPLLVVRSRGPLEAWAMGAGSLRVLLAIDHTWRAETARAWLTKLAGYGALDVLAVHVWAPDDERMRRHTSMADFEQLLLRETTEALRDLPVQVKLDVRVVHTREDVKTTLLRLSDMERAELVVVGPHGKKGLLGMLRSVSHEQLVHGGTSVALVPDLDPVERLDRMTPTSPRTARRMHILREH